VTFPTLEFETELLANFKYVIGLDEVGRGAIAGPVAVGAAHYSAELLETFPKTVRDSKLIAESKREQVASEIASWTKTAVGMVSAMEIDQIGITKALARAAVAALEKFDLKDTVILLDGNSNWLQAENLSAPVIIRTKADRDCGAVAAASVVAKVERDSHMRKLHLEYPAFGWDSNKGYAAADHIAALQAQGPSSYHRVSWLGKILTSETQLFS
jgi:ribonuclease HII